MKNTLLTAALCLVMAFLAGCGSTAEKAVVVTSAESGKEIELNVGQECRIELSANSTTGYAWSVAAAADKVLQESAKSEYVSDPNPDHKVGVGGMQVWHFKAVQAGTQTMKLEYRRPWEKDIKPAQTAQFAFVVK